MASELTAAELAELTEKVKADKHGWSSIRAEWLSALIAAAERADAAEKRVRELEEALKEIGRCDLGPSSADHLIGFRAAALDRRPWLLAECGAGDNKIFCPKCEADMILSANNIWKCPNCEEPRP